MCILHAFVGSRTSKTIGFRPSLPPAPFSLRASSQAFEGDGCVQSPSTRCSCLHLTTFRASNAATIRVASLGTRVGVDPIELLVKTRYVAAACFGLFGAMYLLGGVLYALDARRCVAAVNNLKRQGRFGFSSQRGGAWVWSVQQAPLGGAVGQVAGTAVELAGVLGIPFCRLRRAALLPFRLPPAACGPCCPCPLPRSCAAPYLLRTFGSSHFGSPALITARFVRTHPTRDFPQGCDPPRAPPRVLVGEPRPPRWPLVRRACRVRIRIRTKVPPDALRTRRGQTEKGHSGRGVHVGTKPSRVRCPPPGSTAGGGGGWSRQAADDTALQ